MSSPSECLQPEKCHFSHQKLLQKELDLWINNASSSDFSVFPFVQCFFLFFSILSLKWTKSRFILQKQYQPTNQLTDKPSFRHERMLNYIFMIPNNHLKIRKCPSRRTDRPTSFRDTNGCDGLTNQRTRPLIEMRGRI